VSTHENRRDTFLGVRHRAEHQVWPRSGRTALKARLVACANLIPRIESHYWWQAKIESSAEVLIIFKTTKAKLKALEKLIMAKHPYDTPEFVVLPITAGNKRYLDWVSASVNPKR